MDSPFVVGPFIVVMCLCLLCAIRTGEAVLMNAVLVLTVVGVASMVASPHVSAWLISVIG